LLPHHDILNKFVPDGLFLLCPHSKNCFAHVSQSVGKVEKLITHVIRSKINMLKSVPESNQYYR